MLLTEKSIYDVKPKVVELNNFENRGLTNLIVFGGVSECQDPNRKTRNDFFLLHAFSTQQCEYSSFEGRNRAINYEGNER